MKTKKTKEHFKIRVFILMAYCFYISIGKDCANYDKRHSVYVNEPDNFI
jgi:hypothetical protein